MLLDIRLLCAGLCFLFFITSCRYKAERQSSLKSLDLGCLVDGQVIFLSENNYRLIKTSSLGSSEERTEYVPDSAGWVREMSIIRRADISKPGLRSYYKLESYDSLDYTIEHYTLLDSGNSDILYQKIYRDGNSDRLLKIITLQNVNNPIYDSERYIMITFKEAEKINQVIDSILVEGYQTMILSDTTFYRSVSKILPQQL